MGHGMENAGGRDRIPPTYLRPPVRPPRAPASNGERATSTFALVQRLLTAKRDPRLEKELAALDGFDAVILDDIGYVQQSREEMEVLFTFLPRGTSGGA
jgi:hypothetical protein